VSDVNAEHGSMSGSPSGPDDTDVPTAAADPATPGSSEGAANGKGGGKRSSPARSGYDEQQRSAERTVPRPPPVRTPGRGYPEEDVANETSSDGGSSGEGSPNEDTPEDLSVEGLVSDLERVTAERDQYLETSRRLQAEFENYRKQVTKREAEARQRANEGLIGEMLPVLDAFDGALSSGVEDVAPMRTTLLDTLAKQGLERIDPTDAPFDPNLHEAVMHEEGEGGETGPVVAEVMRAGYSWKGRVVRPAMVKVRG